jgi:hypothetical protein
VKTALPIQAVSGSHIGWQRALNDAFEALAIIVLSPFSCSLSSSGKCSSSDISLSVSNSSDSDSKGSCAMSVVLGSMTAVYTVTKDGGA